MRWARESNSAENRQPRRWLFTGQCIDELFLMVGISRRGQVKAQQVAKPKLESRKLKRAHGNTTAR
ncbi:MAG: hypothetical protein K2R98_10040 [Gemmataceae bacterium]|nr:hypothetical protein [Gemmataceae bacterium]